MQGSLLVIGRVNGKDVKSKAATATEALPAFDAVDDARCRGKRQRNNKGFHRSPPVKESNSPLEGRSMMSSRAGKRSLLAETLGEEGTLAPRTPSE